MENILKEIEAIYNIISTVHVSGDSVDAVAVVRNKLRNIYAEIKNNSENK